MVVMRYIRTVAVETLRLVDARSLTSYELGGRHHDVIGIY